MTKTVARIQLHFGKPPAVNFWLRACNQDIQNIQTLQLP